MNDDVRWDRVREVRWRMKHGYYEMPEVLEEAAERLRCLLMLRQIRECAGRSTCQDGPDGDEDSVVNAVPAP